MCKASKKLKEVCIWRFAHVTDWEAMANRVIETAEKFHVGMLDYLLSDPLARLHFLVVPFDYNGMENFGLLAIKESVSASLIAQSTSLAAA